METRNKKGSKPLTEAELEILNTKLAEQQAQLQEQKQVFTLQCEQFERERNETLQSLAEEREQLRKGSRLESRETRESEDAFKDEILRELNRLRQELNGTRPINSQTSITQRSNNNNQPTVPGEDSAEISPIPKVSFREATESVPTFDGYNISLSQFVRACRRAKEIVPASSERNLTKLLINKLRGRAYYAVEDEPCETITQLIDLLTTGFGSPKTVDQYRGELSTVFIKPNEHMLDYISRVKELRAAIFDTERREKGFISNSLTKEIDKMTAKSFRDGLPLEYRLQMQLDDESDPFTIFGIAKALAKRHELDKQRYDTRPNNERISERHTFTPVGRPIAQSTPTRRLENNTNFRNEPIYRTTHRPVLSRPTNEMPNNQNQRNLPRTEFIHDPRSNDNNYAEKWCRYCKNRGHEIEECRKREYNNSQKQQTSGNAQDPSRRPDAPRVDALRDSRPIKIIEAIPSTSSQSQS